MTNSHNRSGKNGSYTERYFNNHSPQQMSGGSVKRNSSTSNGGGGGNGNRGYKSPSSSYFRSISVSNTIPIVQSTSPVSSKSGNYYSTSSPNGRHNSFNVSTVYQRSSPGGGNMNSSAGSYPGPLSGSPPNFSHFAGSKCYDAPAPTALPKPPVHWTSMSTSTSSSNTTVVSALNTSKTSINKPTSASSNIKNASGKVSSPPSSSSRSKAKSVKPAVSCAAAAARANRTVDFTHNLKMALNVQA